MENKPKQCTWKKIVDMLSNPEGLLRNCYYDCDGYDTGCINYTDSMKGVLGDDVIEHKTGLRKYFIRKDLYKRSRN